MSPARTAGDAEGGGALRAAMRACLLALLLPLAGGVPHSKRVVQVFGARPEGGFWGVEVDVRREGRADPLNWSPLAGVTSEVAGVAYDPRSGHVTLEGHEPHSLSYAPLCAPGGEQKKLHEFVIANETTFTQYTSDPATTCVRCHASAFSLHGTRLYFLLTGDFGTEEDPVGKVQLRMLDPCEHCQPASAEAWDSLEAFGTPFLFNCSHVVANVYSERPPEGAQITLKAGKQLKIAEEDDGGLSFYFQLFVGRREGNKHDVSLRLYHVSPATDVTLLRAEKVHARYAQWNIQAMASVDFRDGVLCWTVADRLYCGRYAGRGRITGEKMLLFPGEGASSQVCTGETLDLLHIITGVAIGETGDKLSVFFGCYPKWPGLGGAGLIRLYRNWSKKRIFPLKVGDERLIAGSITVVSDASATCGIRDYKPEVCTDLPSGPVPEDEPNPGGASQTINENKAPYDVAEEGDKSEPEADPEVPVSPGNSTSRGNDVMTRERTSNAADTIHHRIATTVIIIVAFIDHYI